MALQCLNPAERNVGRDIKGSTLTYIKKVTMPTESGISAHGSQRTDPAGDSYAAKVVYVFKNPSDGSKKLLTEDGCL